MLIALFQCLLGYHFVFIVVQASCPESHHVSAEAKRPRSVELLRTGDQIFGVNKQFSVTFAHFLICFIQYQSMSFQYSERCLLVQSDGRHQRTEKPARVLVTALQINVGRKSLCHIMFSWLLI